MKKKISNAPKMNFDLFIPGEKCPNCGEVTKQSENPWLMTYDEINKHSEDGCKDQTHSDFAQCIKFLRKRIDSIKLIS